MPKVISEILNAGGDFALMDSSNLRGGFMQVSLISDRNNISRDKLKIGMLVYVLEDETIYKWTGVQWETWNSGVSREMVEEIINDCLSTQVFKEGTIVTNVEYNAGMLTVVMIDRNGKRIVKDYDFLQADPNTRTLEIASVTHGPRVINVNSVNPTSFTLSIDADVYDYLNNLIDSDPDIKITGNLVKDGKSYCSFTTTSEVIITPDMINALSLLGEYQLELNVSYKYNYEDESGQQKIRTITKYIDETLYLINTTLRVSTSNVSAATEDWETTLMNSLANKGVTSFNVSCFFTNYDNVIRDHAKVLVYKNEELYTTLTLFNSEYGSSITLDNIEGTQAYLFVAVINPTGNEEDAVRTNSIYFELFSPQVENSTILYINNPSGALCNSSTIGTIPSYPAIAVLIEEDSDLLCYYYLYNSSKEIPTVRIALNKDTYDAHVEAFSYILRCLRRFYPMYIPEKLVLHANKTYEYWVHVGSKRIIVQKVPKTYYSTSYLDNLIAMNFKYNELDGNLPIYMHEFSSNLFMAVGSALNVNNDTSGYTDKGLLLNVGSSAEFYIPSLLGNFIISFSNKTLTTSINPNVDKVLIDCTSRTESGKLAGCQITSNLIKFYTGLDDLKPVCINYLSIYKYKDSLYSSLTLLPYNLNRVFQCEIIEDVVGLYKYLGYVDGNLEISARLSSDYPTAFSGNKTTFKIDNLNTELCLYRVGIPIKNYTALENYYSFRDPKGRRRVPISSNHFLIETPLDTIEKGIATLVLVYGEENSDDIADFIDSREGNISAMVHYYAPIMGATVNLGSADGLILDYLGRGYDFTHNLCYILFKNNEFGQNDFTINLDLKNATESPSVYDFKVGGKLATESDFTYSLGPNVRALPKLRVHSEENDTSVRARLTLSLVIEGSVMLDPNLYNPAQKHLLDESSKLNIRVSDYILPVAVFGACGYSKEKGYEDVLFCGIHTISTDVPDNLNVYGLDLYKWKDEGDSEDTPAKDSICLEFMSNDSPICLFTPTLNSSGQIDETATWNDFKDNIRITYPTEVTEQVSTHGLDSLSTDPAYSKYSYIPAKIKRIFNYIFSLILEVAATTTDGDLVRLLDMNEEDLKATLENWLEQTIFSQLEDYFSYCDINRWWQILHIYKPTNLRAKGLIMYTMDGQHWLFRGRSSNTICAQSSMDSFASDWEVDEWSKDENGTHLIKGWNSWLWRLLRYCSGSYYTVSMADLGFMSLETSPVAYLFILFTSLDNLPLLENSRGYTYHRRKDNSLYDTSFTQRYTTILKTANEAPGILKRNDINMIAINLDPTGTKPLKVSWSDDGYYGWGTTDESSKISYINLQKVNSGDTTNIDVPVSPAGDRMVVLFGSIDRIIIRDSADIMTLPTSLIPPFVDSTLRELSTDAHISVLIEEDLPNIYDNLISFSYYSDDTGLGDIHDINRAKNLKIAKFALGAQTTRYTFSRELQLKYVLIPSTTTYLSLYNSPGLTNTGTPTLEIQGTLKKLRDLVIEDCPNIDWEKIFDDYIDPTFTGDKHLRIVGVDEKRPSSWLDKFTEISGFDDKEFSVTHAVLIGKLLLTDDPTPEKLALYRRWYPNLEIIENPYTIISIDGAAIENEVSGFNHHTAPSVTNISNNTGAHSKNALGEEVVTEYVPSGLILKILNNCHRYLGKVTKLAKLTTIDSSLDSLHALRSVDNTGLMTILRVDDDNSTKIGSTNIDSSLFTGKLGKGVLGTMIPFFNYRSISPMGASPDSSSTDESIYNIGFENTFSNSRHLILFSTLPLYDNNPDITRLASYLFYNNYTLLANKVEKLSDSYIINNACGITVNNIFVTTINHDVPAIIPRGSLEGGYEMFGVDVEGFKKAMLVNNPTELLCIGVLFTDSEFHILLEPGSFVRDYVQEYPTIYRNIVLSIPPSAKYMIVLSDDSMSNSYSQSIVISLHKGSNYSTSLDMNESNWQEWLFDLVQWLDSEKTWLASGISWYSLNSDSTDKYLCTPFTGTARSGDCITPSGTEQQQQTYNSYWGIHQQMLGTGLQAMDWEAYKTVNMLFLAKYGRKDIMRVIGEPLMFRYEDSVTIASVQGDSLTKGMTDSIANYTSDGLLTGAKYPGSDTISYNTNFLGLESFWGPLTILGGMYFYMTPTLYANALLFDFTSFSIGTSSDNKSRKYSMYPSWLSSATEYDIIDICGGLNFSTLPLIASPHETDSGTITSYGRIDVTSNFTENPQNGIFGYLLQPLGISAINLFFDDVELFASPIMGSIRGMFRGTFNTVSSLSAFLSAADLGNRET